MRYENEKDYIMRMIKEMVRVLFSLMLGKHYVQVEPEIENKYTVSGTSLGEFKAMVDRGEVNEAENICWIPWITATGKPWRRQFFFTGMWRKRETIFCRSTIILWRKHMTDCGRSAAGQATESS